MRPVGEGLREGERWVEGRWREWWSAEGDGGWGQEEGCGEGCIDLVGEGRRVGGVKGGLGLGWGLEKGSGDGMGVGLKMGA